MRVLITGGAGFIGSHLTAALLERGYVVRVLDNFVTGRRANLNAFNGDVDIVEGDIQSYECVSRAARDCDSVFHEAALPSVPRSIQDPLASNATNVLGTLNVLLAARDQGVRRVVYASSSSVYGAPTELPLHEELPTRPISPYATTKLAGEGYARSLGHVYGLETVALRYFNVFGPRQTVSSEYTPVVPRFISKLAAEQPPVIFGDGEQSRDFTYVANVVAANLLAMDASGAAGRVYNIACGERVTVNQLFAHLRRLLGSSVEAEFAPARIGDVTHSHADISRARQELGYEPIVSLGDGLMRTADELLGGTAAHP